CIVAENLLLLHLSLVLKICVAQLSTPVDNSIYTVPRKTVMEFEYFSAHLYLFTLLTSLTEKIKKVAKNLLQFL
ncbi:MAG TPA: hypothetical protein VJL87_00875, partial [Bdellovibrionota bacterium]|nr:hypothetical protein [Bdellovibrionota bacterium]